MMKLAITMSMVTGFGIEDNKPSHMPVSARVVGNKSSDLTAAWVRVCQHA